MYELSASVVGADKQTQKEALNFHTEMDNTITELCDIVDGCKNGQFKLNKSGKDTKD